MFEGLTNDHTDEDVDYPTSPPAGGPHDPAWLDCGVYDEPVRDENAVLTSGTAPSGSATGRTWTPTT